MRHFYEITNRTSGAELGTYEADSEEHALDLLAQDAGYADDAAMCTAVPRAPRELEIKMHSVMDAAITDEQIERLQQEAGEAGDEKQVSLCEAALGGDESARAECARVIREARA